METLAEQRIRAWIENFRDPILSHTVLVYDQKTDGNGSGVLLELGKRTFVLTAAHVIENEEILINMGLPGQTEPFSILSKWVDPQLDVGYLELRPYEVELRRGDHIHAYRLSTQRQQTAQHMATTFVLCGFPTEHLIRDGNSRKATPLLIWCALVHHSSWSKFIIEDLGKTPDTNFVIVYGETESRSFFDESGTRMSPVPPFGLSGSGLWYFELGNGNESKPTYSLVGIQTSFVRSEKQLIGTFADKIVHSICNHFQIDLASSD